MSLLNLNLNDVPDLEVLPEGDYELKIGRADIKDYTSDKGNGQYMNISLTVIDEANAPTIYHTIFLPNSSDDESQANAKKRRIIQFYKAFDIDLDGAELSELSGKTGYAFLRIEAATAKYEERNSVGKFKAMN